MKLDTLDISSLRLIFWPDPRLKKVSAPVTVFDASLGAVAARMFELMREHKGVGLAAPQVGLNIRLFVMNAAGEPADDRAYVNPVLDDPAGEDEDEEGCLSLPNIHINVLRSQTLRMRATDVHGNPIEEVQEGFVARVWQHEVDHLNGTLLLDRMGPVARMTHRRVLKEMEERYTADHPAPPPRKRPASSRRR